MFRIMTTSKYKDLISYRAACSCGSDDCGVQMDLEIDKEFSDVTMSIYWDLIYDSEWGPYRTIKFGIIRRFFNRHFLGTTDFYYKWTRRIYCALRVLFIGRLEMSNSFIFSSKRQIKDFIITLEEGLKTLENNKE